MAIYCSQIENFVIEELKRREKEIAINPELTHMSRIPYVVLQSNAAKNGDRSLAEKNILYGGSEEFIKNNINVLQLSSVSDKYKNDGYDVGFRPPPGITNVSVNNQDTLGAIRKATITFTVWTLEELETMQRLYMNPGVQLFLQWGFYKAGQIAPIETIFDSGGIEKLKEKTYIKKKIEEANGNYDAMVGNCANFSWKLNTDGGFECNTVILTPASFVLDFSLDGQEIVSDDFHVWLTNRSDGNETGQSATKNTIFGGQENTELVQKNTQFSDNLKNLQSLLQYLKTSDTKNNYETFFGKVIDTNNEDEVNELYYRYLNLNFVNDRLKKITEANMGVGDIPQEDYCYISLGHLFKLVNHLFIKAEDKKDFENMVRILHNGSIYSKNKSIVNKLIVPGYSAEKFESKNKVYIDMSNSVCRNHIYLRSNNPREVLIINSTAESATLRGAAKYIIQDNTGISDTPLIDKSYRLWEIIKDYRDVNGIDFILPDVENSPYHVTNKFGFTLGDPKRIYINVNTVIDIASTSRNFYKFIDEILGKINTSLGNIVKLQRDADGHDPRRITIIDTTLYDKTFDNIEKVYKFNVYERNTVLKNITLDASLPTEFQTAAYVTNTKSNNNQIVPNQFAAFSAVSDGYIDSKFSVTFDKQSNNLTAPTLDQDDWILMLSEPLYSTKILNYQKRFYSILHFNVLDKKNNIVGYPVGINLNVELDGIGGIYYGNIFKINYGPKFIKDNVIFQITNVNHEITVEGWKTKIIGIMRALTTGVSFTESLTQTQQLSTQKENEKLYIEYKGQLQDVTNKVAKIYSLETRATKYDTVKTQLTEQEINKIVEMVKRFEGFREISYEDKIKDVTTNTFSIGYGFCVIYQGQITELGKTIATHYLYNINDAQHLESFRLAVTNQIFSLSAPNIINNTLKNLSAKDYSTFLLKKIILEIIEKQKQNFTNWDSFPISVKAMIINTEYQYGNFNKKFKKVSASIDNQDYETAAIQFLKQRYLWEIKDKLYSSYRGLYSCRLLLDSVKQENMKQKYGLV